MLGSLGSVLRVEHLGFDSRAEAGRCGHGKRRLQTDRPERTKNKTDKSRILEFGQGGEGIIGGKSSERVK